VWHQARLGSLTLPAPQAGDFEELILLYSAQATAASIGPETASPDKYLFSLTDATQPTGEAR